MAKTEKTILVVDDEEVLGKLIAINLEQRGFKSLTVSTGAEVLRIAAEKKPDLILLDVAIPDISGMDILKTLKADPSTKSIPVVMLSFYPLDKASDIFLKAGAEAYLVKSMEFKELATQIELILERKRNTT